MDSTFRFSLLSSIFALFTAAASAVPPSPSDCPNLILNLADCITFVMVGGSATTPPGNCCSGLKLVIEADADCLCDAFKNSAQFGVTLNVTKALSLPAACHLSAPSLGDCTLSNVPAAAPVPGIAPPLAPSPTPGAGGRAPVPAPGGAAPSPNESAPAPVPVSDLPAPVPSGEESPRSGSSQLLLQVPVMAVAAAISFAVFL